MIPHDLVAAARAYLGVPFRHQGRSAAGLDCLGLLMAVARDLALPMAAADETNYGRSPDAPYLKSRLDAVLERVSRVELRSEGRVALFRFASMAGGHHLGLTTEIGLIHAYAQARAVVETCRPRHWWRATVAVYRVPGVTYG